TVEFYWDWYWHYNAVLMPIALAALLDALGDRRRGRATAWWRRDAPRPGRRVRIVAVAATAAVTLTLGSAMPALDVLRPSMWEPTWRAPGGAGALEAVPDGSVLAVDISLRAHAGPHHDVQWLHGTTLRVPDCVLSAHYAFSWEGSPPADTAGWAQQQWGTDYREVYADGGFTVVCRA